VAAEGGVVGLEAPRDKGRESAGFFLQAANYLEVVNALLEGFAHADIMVPWFSCPTGAPCDGPNPVFSVALKACNSLAHIVVENLRAAAGDGIKTRVAQANDGVAQGEIRILGNGEQLQKL